jgi:ferredoxin
MRHPFNSETLAFIRSVGVNKPARWIHGYIYGTYSHLYLKCFLGLVRGLPNVPKVLNDFAARSYRGKVTTLDDAKRLVRINQEIPIDNLERILTMDDTVNIVYRTGDKVLVTECLCRGLKKNNPCKPSEVCMVMGEPFMSFFARQLGPGNYRWISQQEAIDIIELTEKLGWTHVTFNRDIVGDNFYALCSCCKCCCGTRILERFGVNVLHHSGLFAEVTESCIGCGTCESLCQFDAIHVGEGDTSAVDLRKCQGCGVCASNCQQAAVVLKEVAAGPKPLRLSA